MDMNSLAHTKWECKYHIVFAPKFRRKVIYGQIKADVGNILSMLCKRKGIEIIEAECMPDHVHMFVRIPPKYSVSQIVGYLKGKSSLMIFERHANLKYKYGNRHFWCRGGSLTLRLPLDFHNSLHHSPLRLIFLSNFKILLVIVCHCVV